MAYICIDLLFTLCQNTLDRDVLIVHSTIAHAQNSRHFRFTVRDAELLFSVSFIVVYIFLMVSTFPINLKCSVDVILLCVFSIDNNHNGCQMYSNFIIVLVALQLDVVFK